MKTKSIARSKKRKCLSCKERFEPVRGNDVVCSYQCAASHARESTDRQKQKKLKEAKRENVRQKKELRKNDRPTQIKDLDRFFNYYIKYVRDAGQSCISCGKVWAVDRTTDKHAGHYIPKGRNPALRYSEDNVHLQCNRCNTFLSGNLIEYKKNLEVKLGADRVRELEEASYDGRKLSLPEIWQMIDKYKALIKEAGIALP